ncbi:glycosyltransferase family 4 protein [Pseudarthrobacter sp. H3Y2-7]|uniref:glycosyltransferase family 4 protein n=1 Tax=Pseudarthrobacter naphthalenicus TaxID=3031328 RepID=UPI0023B1EDFE|nr:glycosyltransferase family 4 protein [Pseudarthrobacter sp. H3Y2-7]MDE8670732.1 glycosyltransferase family 4 protein [Pseudarthrobacter sp. H3Y2-7]
MQLVTNLRLAAGTAAQHLSDDPALLLLQISRRLPARAVQAVAQRVRRSSRPDSTWEPVLLASLIGGDQPDVIRRLEAALTRGRLSAEHSRALADIALVADRPDLADAFLVLAKGARRIRAAQARRFWYSGAMSAAVGILENAPNAAERQQGRRLAADLHILQGWRPELGAVRYEPLPRRVLHVLTNSLPHTASGYAQRSHSVLLAQQEAGWETLAVTRLGYPVQVGKLAARRRDVVDGVTYARLLPARLAATMDARLQQQAEALLSVALAFRPAVLHTTTHHVNAIVTRAVAEALNIPWVYEVRGQLADTWAATRGPEARNSERYRLFQEREKEAMLAADLVVTLGKAMKGNIVAAGVPETRVLVAPNAVGGIFLAEPLPAAQARTALGLDPEGQYIGTVSSLVAYEGIDDLISAFALLAPTHPRLKLLIVGDGVSSPALKEQVRALDLGGRVIFTGRVPRSKAHLHHQALDLFVVPRKDLPVTRDVTPLKPVEAMACARPVVASRLPALAEIVDEGVSGLLADADNPADLAEKLGPLLASAELQLLMGSSGRRAVLETRTWAANASAMSAAYTKLMEKAH